MTTSDGIAAYDRHRAETELSWLVVAEGTLGFLQTNQSRAQVLYALALVPVGLLADRVHRPRLLAAGITVWSLLTMAASRVRRCPLFGDQRARCRTVLRLEIYRRTVSFAKQVNSFGELLALRIGFAAAQATQNPVCFSLIPELFPRERSTAMAAYNAAIYMGRALSFAAVILADQLGIPTGDIGVTMVRPLCAGANLGAPAQERWPFAVGAQARGECNMAHRKAVHSLLTDAHSIVLTLETQ